MAFTPEKPASTRDLMATFDVGDRLNGLLYKADGVLYSRIDGEWEPLGGNNNPLGQGAAVVFVSPDFIMEFDARMMYREYLSQGEVQKNFGVTPKFGNQ